MKLGKKFFNKRRMIIVSILLGTLLFLTGCGKAEVSVKTYDKENGDDVKQLSKVENTTEETNEVENKNIEKNTTIEETKNLTTKAFSRDDLTINNQFRLGESAQAIEHYYAEKITSVRTTYEDATGRDLVILDCEELGLEVENYVSDNNPDGEMIRIKLKDNSKLKTARGIKISDSKDKILNAYKSESILENEDDYVVVGYPGDDSVYETNKGKIYFYIENGKVHEILLAYGIAE